jgi:hypothetical protein
VSDVYRSILFSLVTGPRQIVLSGGATASPLAVVNGRLERWFKFSRVCRKTIVLFVFYGTRPHLVMAPPHGRNLLRTSKNTGPAGNVTFRPGTVPGIQLAKSEKLAFGSRRAVPDGQFSTSCQPLWLKSVAGHVMASILAPPLFDVYALIIR